LQGQTLSLVGTETSLGRGDDVTYTIDHMSVSRHHCDLLEEDGVFRVRDNESTNGTLVNGVRVHDRVLQHGDSITLGTSTFLFLLEEDAPPATDITLTDLVIDSGTVELRGDKSSYLRPSAALAGADVRAVRAFEILLKLITNAQASQSLAVLEEHALKLLMEEIPAGAATIVLTTGYSDEIFSMLGRRADGSQNILVSRTVLARVLRDKTPILNNDVQEAITDARSLIDSETRSLLCVPLVSGTRAYGAIYMTAEASGLFDEFHLQLLTAAAALLAMPLEKARQVEWLTSENRRLNSDIDDNHRLIGNGEAMKKVYDFIARVAPAGSTVLIRGESGTGKELIAHALHRNSQRANAPFIVVNCAVLKGELLESELFGHEKGAFTSAVAQRKGKFEIADGGTIFLDEIAELAPELQVKLLRVLQEFEFERVGGTRPLKVDVRVIAATDRDLEEAMRQERFRPELYYRLNVVSIESPALRRRAEDIVPLANYFTARYAGRYNNRVRGISAEAEACLKRYDWPGNVRELQNAIERAVVLSDSDLILPEDLPESVLDVRPPSDDSAASFHRSVREVKRQKIQSALKQADGNVAEAARLLGVNRTYLHRLIRNLGLDESNG
jgi:Nif-specific regulatory protein